MELGSAPPFFLERIRGGVTGAGYVWLENFESRVGFSDLKLCGDVPNTPLGMTSLFIIRALSTWLVKIGPSPTCASLRSFA
jgi:hypothetical protein